jgi:hypothetical protein
LVCKGDIIIDMSLMREIDIEPPQTSKPRGYTELRDMLVATSKGKGKVNVPLTTSSNSAAAASTIPTTTSEVPPDAAATAATSKAGQKRRRDDSEEEDVEEKAAYEIRLKMYDTASPAVSSFFSGPPLVPDAEAVLRELPKQTPGTRAHSSSEAPAGGPHSVDTRLWSFDAMGSGGGSGTGGHVLNYGGSTDDSFLLSHTGGDDDDPTQFSSSSSARSDPFGYLNASSDVFLAGNSSQAQSAFHPSYQPWTASLLSSSSIALQSSSASSNLFSAFDAFNVLPQVSNLEPVHPHAFVTFGAGMKQKEIDIFTASNPLEAVPVGTDGLNPNTAIPYHVPTSVCFHTVLFFLLVLDLLIHFLTSMQGCASMRIFDNASRRLRVFESDVWIKHR